MSSLSANLRAISLLLKPATMVVRMSISRFVRPKFFGGRSPDALRRMNSTMSPTASRPIQYSPAITVRIAFISNCVAASFMTTPRAPSCSACTI